MPSQWCNMLYVQLDTRLPGRILWAPQTVMHPAPQWFVLARTMVPGLAHPG